MLVSEVVTFFAITISVFIARRFLDHRSISSLGLALSTKVISDLSIGFFISLLSLSLVFVLESMAGWIENISFAWQTQPFSSVITGTILAFILFVLVGWNEELLSRGYHLQTIASGINLPVGIILSSAIFGILHLANPNATWTSAVGIFLAGLFLAYGYVRTGRLWLSIGLHIGWNFSEGVLFGFPVSGWNSFRLMNYSGSGPTLWTGSTFGPEGGLIVFPAIILGIILIYLITRSEGKNKSVCQ